MLHSPLDFRDRRRARRWPWVALVLVALAGGGAYWVFGRSSSSGSPGGPVRAFLSAWERNSLDEMRSSVVDPPAAMVPAYRDFRAQLHVVKVATHLDKVDRHHATVSVVVSPRGLPDWHYVTTLDVVRRAKGYAVRWSPAALHPQFRTGLRWTRTRRLPARASILDGAGTPLTGPGAVVVVGVVSARVTDADGLIRAVDQQTDLTAAEVTAALHKAAAAPRLFTPLITLRESAYAKAKPVLYPVPGLVFRKQTRQLTPSATFARQVLGRVGEVTAEQLKQLPATYQAGDLVGLSGLERTDEARLAGVPSGDIGLRGSGRSLVVAHLAGHPGSAVRTTLNRHVQAAAEAALNAVGKPVALVVVSVRDGSILADANRPSSGFDRGRLGHYPPGSTFKIVTAAALLQSGMSPSSALDCPATLTIGGRTFRNFEGERLGPTTLATAFAASCNTAFLGATRKLPTKAWAAAARSFGFTSVPAPKDSVEYAADAIGQGRVSASPLDMAAVAAAVASGRWHQPILVPDRRSKPAVAAPLAANVAVGLRTLMRGVVTSGTGTAANVAGPPVYGKTGTAEFGAGATPQTHAWFVGYRGDLAFAVLVEGGGVGGQVAAPIAAAFLRAL